VSGVPPSSGFDAWLLDLERRHMADLTFSEVSRSLAVLSATYVQRRDRLAEGVALTGRGKRAAFALYFGPLHYLLTRGIVERLPEAVASRRPLIDLGCGTGAAGLAWAGFGEGGRDLTGVDVNAWALGEAAFAYRCFRLRARTVRGSLAGLAWPRGPLAIVAAFSINELTEADRAGALPRLLERVALGDQVLIIEPLAKGVAPWWGAWRREFEAVGGRADEWRIHAELPPLAARLGRASRLHHRELTGRSLWYGGVRSALTD
jgi:hypothetical protein